MTVVVTGASGNFGRSAAERFLAVLPPSELILTTRNPDSLADFAARGVTVRQADFDSPVDELAEAFRGADKMLLISALAVGKRVAQHGRAIEAAVKAGVTHIAYTSFIGSPDSDALVATEHTATEKMMADSGAAYTYLRNNQYAEAVSDVIAPMIIANGVWRGSAAEGKVGFVSREDCAAAAVAVLTTPGHENKAYDICGPDAMTCAEAGTLIGSLVGKEIGYVTITDDELYAQFDAIGAPRAFDPDSDWDAPWCSDDMVSFERAIREGYLAKAPGDVEMLTGQKPRSLRDVILERVPGASA